MIVSTRELDLPAHKLFVANQLLIGSDSQACANGGTIHCMQQAPSPGIYLAHRSSPTMAISLFLRTVRYGRRPLARRLPQQWRPFSSTSHKCSASMAVVCAYNHFLLFLSLVSCQAPFLIADPIPWSCSITARRSSLTEPNSIAIPPKTTHPFHSNSTHRTRPLSRRSSSDTLRSTRRQQ